MRSALAAPVERFIDDLTPVLARIAEEAQAAQKDRAAGDVALEAYNMAAAFIDVDGLHTDEELWAFVTTFAPRFDTMLGYATPSDVRKAGLISGKRHWLEKASVLLEILLADDRRRGTTNAWRYYEGAMAIAHAVCSIDAHPARSELEAVDRFRSLLLATMTRWDVPRPGTPPVARAGVPPPPAQPPEQGEPRQLEELLAELDALVGLEPVKAEVRLVANLIQVQNLRRQRGLPVAESSRHLVFTGNPGTGKTTVARLLAQIYRTLGVVAKGHLVETDRSQLVAGYVGQTAIQVRKVVEQALGGVLLIDEAYALARGDQRDFGQEATDTLVKLMEDHRDEVVVIAAGYPEEMARFVESNPGLRSRFPKTVFFPDYSTDELVAIFHALGAKSGYQCGPDAAGRLREWFDAQPRDKGFGNARLARNLFEAAVARQASRVVSIEEPTNEELVLLTGDDIAPPAPASGRQP
ncbi:MAG: AAA family ATPase [Actinomycetota bacterium]|nr:AAA family ATPase [Actinomycetota bacterium]